MKTILSYSIFALLILAQTALAQSGAKKNLKEEFKTLGDNEEVVERVRQLDNQQRVRVVQNRLVDRNHRVELAFDYGALSGGDSYVTTQNMGGALHYHISPRWSLGLEYQKANNTLTSEGKRLYENAYNDQKNDGGTRPLVPEVDFPLETKMATISFYPIYGKLNLFDWSIAQFDLYTLLGYGTRTMDSGSSDLFAAGLGSGIWLNNYLTARLEVRYEKYQDLLQTVRRDQNAMSAMASVGIMIW